MNSYCVNLPLSTTFTVYVLSKRFWKYDYLVCAFSGIALPGLTITSSRGCAGRGLRKCDRNLSFICSRRLEQQCLYSTMNSRGEYLALKMRPVQTGYPVCTAATMRYLLRVTPAVKALHFALNRAMFQLQWMVLAWSPSCRFRSITV